MKVDHNTRRAIRAVITSWNDGKSATWIDSQVDDLMRAIARRPPATDDKADATGATTRFSLLEMDR